MLKGFKSYSKSHEIYIISDLFNVQNKGKYYFRPACPQRCGIPLLYLAYRSTTRRKRPWLCPRRLTVVPFVCWFVFHHTPPDFLQGSLEPFLIFLYVRQHTPVWRSHCEIVFKNYSALFKWTFKKIFDPLRKREVDPIQTVKSRVSFRLLKKSFQYKWSHDDEVMQEADWLVTFVLSLVFCSSHRSNRES